MRTVTDSLKSKRVKTNKLVLGFVGIVATTIMGTAGLAAAQQTRDPSAPNPSSKAACADYAHYGFKNHGQCVHWWNQHKNDPGNGGGSGYGGGGTTNNNVNTNVNVSVNGNHNVISIALSYIFGH